MSENHKLVNQDSGKFEYFTPSPIIEAARETMGSIDLDPFSSKAANEIVKAERYFDKDGLRDFWIGNIWMNHPFSRGWNACKVDLKGVDLCKRVTCEKRGYHVYEDVPSNDIIIQKLLHDWQFLHITASCNITYAATSEQWFRPLLRFPQCFLWPRTDFYLPDGTLKRGVTKGSVVTYLGQEPERFRDMFEHKYKLGKVKI